MSDSPPIFLLRQINTGGNHLSGWVFLPTLLGRSVYTTGVKMNRHAANRMACQACHIKAYAKCGATEMSRDWGTPVWNQALCNGQGGYVGHEVKDSNVTPEYRWFDGTVTMAKANGKIFDGKFKIVPIKNHTTTKIALMAMAGLFRLRLCGCS